MTAVGKYGRRFQGQPLKLKAHFSKEKSTSGGAT